MQINQLINIYFMHCVEDIKQFKLINKTKQKHQMKAAIWIESLVQFL